MKIKRSADKLIVFSSFRSVRKIKVYWDKYKEVALILKSSSMEFYVPNSI